MNKDNNRIRKLLSFLDTTRDNEYWYPLTRLKNRHTDSSEKWMIYVSHEGTITFEGEDIVEFAKKILPAEYLY